MIVRCLLAAGLVLCASGAAFAAASPATAAAPADAGAAVFGALDTNHDKALSLPEFQAGWASLQRTISLELRLHEQFQAVDGNHSGALESGEYAALLLVRQAGKAAPPLSAFDANGDQKLQFGEYLAMVRRLAPVPATTGK